MLSRVQKVKAESLDDAINKATLTLGTGVSLKGINLSKKADYDGDGILNGDEIAIYEYKDRIYIKVFSDPASKDSDHDGLLDGEERTVNGKKVLPKDPDPLKINGPEGIWEAQYEQELSGNIPHKLGDSYKLDWSWKDIAASVGSKLLNFKLDDKKLHFIHKLKLGKKLVDIMIFMI